MYVAKRFRGTRDDMLPPEGGDMCFNNLNSWGCTRELGHDGVHRAGTFDGLWAAEWDDDRSTDDSPRRSEKSSDFFDSIGL